MSRLTVILIEESPQFLNVLKDRELDLRGNNISMIENLGVTKDSFDTIDLSDNRIHHLDGLPLLRRLKNIYLSNNMINFIDSNLSRNLPELTTLILTSNNFTELSQLEPLKQFKNLRFLSLDNNPVQRKLHYKYFIISLLPELKYLDSQRIKPKDRDTSRKLFKDKETLVFDPGEEVDVAPKKKELTKREKEVIRAALDNCKSVEDINRYEMSLQEGILPEELRGKL